MEGGKRKITTILRIRPILYEEIAENTKAKQSVIRVQSDNKKISLIKEALFDREFEFDGIAHYKAFSQEAFYNKFCYEGIMNLFNGINTTFVTYGNVTLF